MRFFFRDLKRQSDTLRGTVLVLLAVWLCFAVTALVLLGYIATRAWQEGVEALLRRRQAEALALTAAALDRDRNGAWISLLAPLSQVSIQESPPYTLLRETARTFARLPYPESLLLWRTSAEGESTYVFNRTDRRPPWEDEAIDDRPFPITLVRDPPQLRSTVAQLQRDASTVRPYAVRHVDIAGIPYQIVARFLFDPLPPHRVSGIAAFTVNMDWLRREYFEPLIQQVARIGGNENVLSFTVIDGQGQVVVSTGDGEPPEAGLVRRFSPLFVSPSLIDGSEADSVADWSIHVAPASDDVLVSALTGARRAFILMALSAGISIVGLVLTVRAVQANANLAAMKSDFVSAVTHELKTPLALIRLVADTLSSGRYSSKESVQEYARLLATESSRLTREIDSLLAFARYTDSRVLASLTFSPTHVNELIDDALERFKPKLAELGFHFSTEAPETLPPVEADHAAAVQAFGNLIDNAIKYSDTQRDLKIVATQRGSMVEVAFADRGIGMAPADSERVLERFYRGRNAKGSGSGLGLALVDRIVRRHKGTVRVQSVLNQGTTVVVALPIWHGDDEKADSAH